MSDDENPDSLTYEIDNFYEDNELDSTHSEDTQKIIETLTEQKPYISEETNEYSKIQIKDKGYADIDGKVYSNLKILKTHTNLKHRVENQETKTVQIRHDSGNDDSNVSDYSLDQNKSNDYCVNEIKSDLRKLIEDAESKFDQTEIAIEEILNTTRKNTPSQTTTEISEDDTKTQKFTESEHNEYCVEDIKSDLRKLIDGAEIKVNDNNLSERHKKDYNHSETVQNEIDKLLLKSPLKSKQSTSNIELAKNKMQKKTNYNTSVHIDKINAEPDVLVLSSRAKYRSQNKADRVDSLDWNTIHDKAEWRLRYF